MNPYLLITLRYSFAQEGSDLSLTITFQKDLPTPQPYTANRELPPDYYPPAVIFKDSSGQVLVQQSLPIVTFIDNVAIDAGLLAEWVAVVTNDPQYTCVQLETPPSISTTDPEISIELPLKIC